MISLELALWFQKKFDWRLIRRRQLERPNPAPLDSVKNKSLKKSNKAISITYFTFAQSVTAICPGLSKVDHHRWGSSHRWHLKLRPNIWHRFGLLVFDTNDHRVQHMVRFSGQVFTASSVNRIELRERPFRFQINYFLSAHFVLKAEMQKRQKNWSVQQVVSSVQWTTPIPHQQKNAHDSRETTAKNPIRSSFHSYEILHSAFSLFLCWHMSSRFLAEHSVYLFAKRWEKRSVNKDAERNVHIANQTHSIKTDG